MQEDGSDLPTWITIGSDLLVAAPMLADTGIYTFVVKATDPDGAMATDTFMLVVDGYPTGISEIETGMFNVTMYPNPSKGEVNLKINSSEIMDMEVVVRTITGSEVLRKEYKASEQIKIDLSDNVSGIYLVTLQMGDKSVIRKLILDRK